MVLEAVDNQVGEVTTWQGQEGDVAVMNRVSMGRIPSSNRMPSSE